MKKEYIPIKVGKTGSKVHAGYVAGSAKKGYNEVPVYGYECTVVNTHNINHHPRVYLLSAGTMITCENCRRIMGVA